ncbi:MAG: hypothetical protein JW719_13360 [Pirellulales bacterium]|nr:hypothetical protein [Pirellulales bacterium]
MENQKRSGSIGRRRLECNVAANDAFVFQIGLLGSSTHRPYYNTIPMTLVNKMATHAARNKKTRRNSGITAGARLADFFGLQEGQFLRVKKRAISRP